MNIDPYRYLCIHRPAFLDGTASIFSVADTPDYAQPDSNAIRSDWQAIGDDIREAIAQIQQEMGDDS